MVNGAYLDRCSHPIPSFAQPHQRRAMAKLATLLIRDDAHQKVTRKDDETSGYVDGITIVKYVKCRT
jgi:hypothetical protein